MNQVQTEVPRPAEGTELPISAPVEEVLEYSGGEESEDDDGDASEQAYDANDPNVMPAGLTGGGDPSDDEPDPDAPPEGATIANCAIPPMVTYYPVYIPPMCAPPQPFGYCYQPMEQDAYTALKLSSSDFDFYRDDLDEQTEDMMKSLEIPMYGPMIAPFDNASMGDAAANFAMAQNMSSMRFEGEVADPNYGNKYIGERDPNGFRQGYGTFTFSDGSLYMGQWWQGLRHGFGEYRLMNGAVYRGQWAYDLKHGFGKFEFSGNQITGVWLHDRLNGRAVVSDAGAPSKEVIYKDDLRIQYQIGGMRWWQTLYFIAAGIFDLAVIAGVIIGLVVDTFGWIILIAAYVLYWCWSCCMPSTRYIQNCIELPQVYKDADHAIQSPPEIVFHMECFHYRRVRRKTKNGVKIERKKVVTWRGTRMFKFHEWVDQSPPSYTLNYLEKIHVARMYTDKQIDLSPRARDRRRNQYSQFVNNNRWRDVHYKAWQSENIPGLYEHTLVLNEKIGGRPWYTGPVVLCILDILVFGWLQRYMLISKTPETYYALKKYIIY